MAVFDCPSNPPVVPNMHRMRLPRAQCYHHALYSDRELFTLLNEIHALRRAGQLRPFPEKRVVHFLIFALLGLYYRVASPGIRPPQKRQFSSVDSMAQLNLSRSVLVKSFSMGTLNFLANTTVNLGSI